MNIFIQRFAFLLVAAPLCAAPLTKDQAFQALLPWEGFKLTSYQDGPGRMSVGLGHSLTANREPVMARYTEEDCMRFFDRDFANAQRICRKGITDFDDLPLDAQEVAIGLAFTCGPTGFMKWVNLRRALSRRAWQNCVVELADSKWFRQDVSPARANAALRVLQAHAR